MNSRRATDNEPATDLAGLAENLGKAAARLQSVWTDWGSPFAGPDACQPDAEHPAGGLAGLQFDPAKLLMHQMDLWRDYQALWLGTTARMMGGDAPAVIEPPADDHRFRDTEWVSHPVFDFLKQSYLLHARWVQRTLSEMQGLDPDTARKLEFFSRTVVEALAPTNFALTNPQVVRETVRSNGENLVRGLRNLQSDLQEGRDGLRPQQTDLEAFEVGRNLAATPGSVIHQTPLMQLIQYTPTTERVYRQPLLIVPPWINKFYILDLRPKNSFVRWALEQGYTVFMISWVNPDEGLADQTFDDYVRDGLFAALDAIEQATGENQVSAIGYCIGGTLLAAALALMAARNDPRIANATFFAAQADFEDAGDLRIFTDPANVDLLEPQVRARGFLDGAQMASAFNALRSTDLIWYFVINNYLLGKDPPAFDLLYWNADSTRFPAQLLMDYLRGLYQRNALARKGEFELAGVPLDLGAVRIPVYIQAGIDDHIAPACSVFKLNRLFGGPKRFVLAAAGHIAGVVNPPEANKYRHWVNPRRKSYPALDAWREDAVERPGSWWPDWNAWLARRSGPKVAARIVGGGGTAVIEPAPGSYVRVRS